MKLLTNVVPSDEVPGFHITDPYISINATYVSNFAPYYPTSNLISPLVILAQIGFDEAKETSMLYL
jgi:hypothetical protein